MALNESTVEEAAIIWFDELGYKVAHGPHLAPGEPATERDSFGDVVLVNRLREAIRRLNPAIPEDARDEALRKVLRVGTPALVQTSRAVRQMLRDGVSVECPRPDGSIGGDHVRLVDYENVEAIDWIMREGARAKIMVLVKRILNKHCYPPRPARGGSADGLGPGGTTVCGVGLGTQMTGDPQFSAKLHV